jgi:hypothetical protein
VGEGAGHGLLVHFAANLSFVVMIVQPHYKPSAGGVNACGRNFLAGGRA